MSETTISNVNIACRPEKPNFRQRSSCHCLAPGADAFALLPPKAFLQALPGNPVETDTRQLSAL